MERADSVWESTNSLSSRRVSDAKSDWDRPHPLKATRPGCGPRRHVTRPVERPFRRSQRDRVTVLVGGLTKRHDRLILAALEGLGYKAGLVPTPTKADYQAGKEYGNNGQCNPTYFAVGALVNYLKRLRDEEGISVERILEDYVFLTAGACGPCRFGMYEAEYRLALRNSGFDGFRVILFDQTVGTHQPDANDGLEFNLKFCLSLANAFVTGDLLNAVANHVRPYETTPGQTNDLLNRCLELCARTMQERLSCNIRGGLWSRLLSRVARGHSAADIERFRYQLRSTHSADAFLECARLIGEEVRVDYTCPKPIVKITGEFWAQTTEGDGNMCMIQYLEDEGAEVLVEPVTSWITYLIHQARTKRKDRRGLPGDGEALGEWSLVQKCKRWWRYHTDMFLLRLAESATHREYERLRCAIGGTAHGLVPQQHLERLAHPYYNSRCRGGEGHLEVAKNIYFHTEGLAHMVLSLKSFGCMPSTQSDGAQAAVMADYPHMLFQPIETSGEGDISALSRVQMMLAEANARCKDAFALAVAKTGYTIQQIRAYVADHRELQSPLQPIPRLPGVVGRAANFVIHVGGLMDKDPQWSRSRRHAGESGLIRRRVWSLCIVPKAVLWSSWLMAQEDKNRKKPAARNNCAAQSRLRRQTSPGGGRHGGSCGRRVDSAFPRIGRLQTVPGNTPPRAKDRHAHKEALPFDDTTRHLQELLIGLDVGSTTVKAVVVDPATDEILWKDYERHNARQPEVVLDFLRRIESADANIPMHAYRVFVTGSGGAALAPHLGSRFVQEVNAVSLAVERLYPTVRSVIELGGQDTKIIVYKEDVRTGTITKIPTMNDKCAGGTGVVIDKIAARLGIPPAQLCQMEYRGLKLHPVAGKCGVFAETDIIGLQKQGVPTDELMASLFESIVQQNSAVLTRGHTLRPTVLLLGGPNWYIKGMRDCWKHNILCLWKERGIEPAGPSESAADYIITPPNAHYYAAIGAAQFGKLELAQSPHTGTCNGLKPLHRYVDFGRRAQKHNAGTGGLIKDDRQLARFNERYGCHSWGPPAFSPGTQVEGFVGLDGGSTSTKAVLIDVERNVIAKAYRLSEGNPIEDSMDILASLEKQITDRGCELKVLGLGTTGYAKEMLRDVFRADVALVETVAHAQGGLHFHPSADVIVDVGGQDIKILFVKDGRVGNFRLNSQCSAGNGYFLQATACSFGHDVRDFADIAFTARRMPEFSFGCAVFLQSDVVNFQRQGWQPNEIMAGLAAVLPKNVWRYVAQAPNLAKLGTTFVLQGGTHQNLAVVKAQVDYIESRFTGTGVAPEIIVHQHCRESGAIGSAIEAHRLWARNGRPTPFIGMDAVKGIRYRSTRNESTRCSLCKNKCLRTFIDIGTDLNPVPIGGVRTTPHPVPTGDGVGTATCRSEVPLGAGKRRVISATCEKGRVGNVRDVRAVKRKLAATMKANPNLVEVAARDVFLDPQVERVADPLPRVTRFTPWSSHSRWRRRGLMQRRGEVRIGIPRVLSMYSLAPFVTGYFTSLGVPFGNIVWSDYTSKQLYKAGAKRGAIDPCFPSKLGIPHVHNLLAVHHVNQPLTHILFPMIDSLPTFLFGVQGSRACPTVVATAEATRAAFVKEGDIFARQNIVFKKTFLNLDEPLLCARQMYDDWKDDLGLSPTESERAVLRGLQALRAYQKKMRVRAAQVIRQLEDEQRLGIVLLARPYHNDPGINHAVCAALQRLGYPILPQDALPIDGPMLEKLFGPELASGHLTHPLSVEDVWKNSYSENTSRKVWAAKYIARHPNLVALELSSFKCGHDAPIYSLIEEIIERSGTPYSCLKDIDENEPNGSIKIRIQTIAYSLACLREEMFAQSEKRQDRRHGAEDLERPSRSLGSLEESMRIAV